MKASVLLDSIEIEKIIEGFKINFAHTLSNYSSYNIITNVFL